MLNYCYAHLAVYISAWMLKFQVLYFHLNLFQLAITDIEGILGTTVENAEDNEAE